MAESLIDQCARAATGDGSGFGRPALRPGMVLGADKEIADKGVG
ncbi:hypothetical protein [Mycobacterium intracellulare]|nr:hypothetical protein [Mycobacterium intracellulare]